MDPTRRFSDGVSRPSTTASTASTLPRHSSHDMRDSQASSASAANSSHPAPTQSISFATPDHGVVSVNLTDLSNALGVRRADVVSQRMHFQARSAPSHRIDRSLLSSALGAAGRLGGNGGNNEAGPTFSPTSDVEHNNAAAVREALRGGTVTPPPAPRVPQYQRRHSTLRGTQVEGDALATAGVAVAAAATSPSHSSGLPPLSSSLLISRHPPRRGTPPPPGGANALRRALAGGDRSSAFAAGSVPSPLRLSAGLLSRTGPSYSASLSSYSGSRGGLRGEAGEERETRNNNNSYNEDDEGTSLLASVRGDPLARAVLSGRLPAAAEAHHEQRDRLAIPGRRSSSPTAVSRSSGTPTPPPQALPCEEGSGDGTPVAAASPSRSVHFSENVIESVSLARGEDEYMHLLVVYSRPWYAYMLLAVFGALSGLSFFSVFYLERNQPQLKDRAISVPFMLFLVTLLGTVVMLLHLAAVWRPDTEEERGFFEDPEQRSRLPRLWTIALLAAAGVTLALVFSPAMGSTVTTVMVTALVGHLLTETVCGGETGEYVTSWDVVGSAVAVLGALLTVGSTTLSEAWCTKGTVTLQGELLVLLVWGLSVLVTGVCWTAFTRQLREMSQRVSQQFLLSTSLTVCTAALGIGAFMADAVLGSDAAAQEKVVESEFPRILLGQRVSSAVGNAKTTTIPPQGLVAALVPCYCIFPDLLILLGGCLCSLLCWYAYHSVSFYVDHIAGAACMVIGAACSTSPLLLFFAVQRGPSLTTEAWALVLALAVGGMLAHLVGSGMVVFSGVRCRREVEIRIVVE